jgi:hypothetical protein
VFGENVTHKALAIAKADLEKVGYRVEMCKLSCGELGADHRRDRYWLLAVKDENLFQGIAKDILQLPKLNAQCWADEPDRRGVPGEVTNRREQLKAIGNAQSPLVVASIFRILVNRLLDNTKKYKPIATKEEIAAVFEKRQTWIKRTYGEDFGLVHTPTTMANYSAPSMMKHWGCRNFKQVFDKPSPLNAEYLMGFPIGASSLEPQSNKNLEIWIG